MVGDAVFFQVQVKLIGNRIRAGITQNDIVSDRLVASASPFITGGNIIFPDPNFTGFCGQDIPHRTVSGKIKGIMGIFRGDVFIVAGTARQILFVVAAIIPR